MNDIADIYELTPVQQGMLFHALVEEPGAGMYVEQLTLELEGDLPPAIWQRAWQQVVDRHAILRSAFHWDGLEKPVQVVHRAVELPWRIEDWSGAAPEEQRRRLERFLREDRARGFALDRAPLMRCALIAMGAGKSQFVWTHHHLLLDGWCLGTVLGDVAAFARAARRGQALWLPEPRPYRDYIAWLQGQDAEKARAFWRSSLSGFAEPTPLPWSRGPAGDDVGDGGAAVAERALPEGLTASLAAFARERRLTLNTLVQGAWALLLGRAADREEALFGVTVSGRPVELAGVESSVGLFINTLPLRVRIDDRQRLDLWLGQIQAAQRDIEGHAYSSLADIQGWSEAARERTLFESLLVFENYPLDAGGLFADLGLRSGALRIAERTNYPLTLIATPGPRLHLRLLYEVDRFEQRGAERILEAVEELLGAMARDPEAALARLSPLSENERRRLLVEWNATAGEPARAPVHALVAAQARRTPEAIAVEMAGARRTYRELDEEAEALAGDLRALGVGPDGRVALCLDRSVDLAVCALGVLKAGGACVPLDPSYPRERLVGMLADSGAKVLVTERKHRELLPAEGLPVVVRDEARRLKAGAPRLGEEPGLANQPFLGGRFLRVRAVAGRVCPPGPKGTRLRLQSRLKPAGIRSSGGAGKVGGFLPRGAGGRAESRSAPVIPACGHLESAGLANLAYVLYTSGSTGKPKGVAMEHGALANLVAWQLSLPSFRQGARVLQFAPLSFDVSFQELFSTWCSGGTLVLLDEETRRSPPDLVRLLAHASIERLFLPAVALHALALEAERMREPLQALREVITAGEQLKVTPAVRAFFARVPGRTLHNQYGPTETHVVSGHLLSGDPAAWPELPPIGRPISNARLYLLDSARRPVPAGVAGELYAAGACLARGYLGQEALTGERFLRAALEGVGVERLYRTGDVARLGADGALEFLGRNDEQVKIRGFRVEPGEIEAALCEHPSVAEAAVVAREDPVRGKSLAAFVVPARLEPGGALDPAALRTHLKGRLPEYLVPAAFARLPALPRTPSGKVDRRALPQSVDKAPLSREPRAPRTAREEILAGIWAEVLGQSSVGIDDDFFELGGHSLKATQIVSRARDAFSVELPVRQLFEKPTVAALAAEIERLQGGGSGALLEPIAPVERGGAAAPASFSQQQLWFLDRLAGPSSAYNLPVVLRLRGPLDAGALEASLARVVARHEILRTTFEEVDGEPRQRIAPAAADRFAVEDLTGLETGAWLARAQEEVRRPFDLARGPLLRARLYRLAEQDHALALILHHAAADAWSFGVLAREVAQVYAALLDGRDPALPALEVQFADYAAWQRQRLAAGRLEEGLAYWRRALEGAPRRLELPADGPVREEAGARGSVFRFELDRGLRAKVEALARRAGATPFMALLSGFAATLSRLCGERDLVIGTAMANRSHPALERLIGYFVNTVALRVDLAGDPDFGEILQRVRRAALSADAHQDVPFEKVVEAQQPDRRLGQNPLFQVMFVLQNALEAEVRLPGLDVELVPVALGGSKFELTLSMEERRGGGYGAAIEYQRDRFSAERIERLAGHLRVLLEAAVQDPERPLSGLPLLTPEERARMLALSGAEGAKPPIPPGEGATAIALFEAQAALAPDAIAVAEAGPGGAVATYGELDRWANRLGHALRRGGAGRDSVVALCAPSSAQRVAAALGIWKAGAAFLPLDAAYPQARLDFMLADSGARVLVTTAALAERFGAFQGARVLLSEDRAAAEPESRPAPPADPPSLAYVIYTSGSTGQPKGALIEHRGLPNLVRMQREELQVGPGSRVLQFASPSFDASVWELVMALCTGARLQLAGAGALLAGDELARALNEGRVTHALLPPSSLLELPEGEYPDLKVLVSGGEACPQAVVDRWANRVRLFNAYGPTECTVCATIARCRPGEAPALGRPFPGVEVYVLDEGLHPAPVGVPGELHVGGACVGRGYLNRPELTEERFIAHPFSEASGRRLYKTGDRASFRPDGALDYLGRADDQIKLRGFRVELGEVEAALLALEGVAQAAAAVSDQVLVGYVVLRPGASLEEAEGREALRARLPPHLVPARLAAVDAIPKTPSGKVDRKRLPALAPSAGAEDRAAPRDAVEEALARIIASALEREAVGIHDDFFALGGHSLKAARVASMAREALGVELPLRAFFERPTVAGLAALAAELKAAGGAAQAAIARRPRDGSPLPVSHAQEQLLLLEELSGPSATYNVPLALRIRGRVSAAALEEALRALVARHEILRTSFSNRGGQWGQQIGEVPARVSAVEDLGGLPWAEVLERVRAESARPFDLRQGPLLRARLFLLGEGDQVLAVTLHHAAADLASLEVLLRELGTIYAAGGAAALPELALQYADWAAWQRERAEQGALAAGIEHFERALAGAPAAIGLPADRPRSARPARAGGTRAFDLSPAARAGLEKVARRTGASLFMTLLGGFAAYLSRITGQADLVLGSPAANRDRPELEGLIGFFVNTLALRIDLTGDPSFETLVERVRRTCLDAFSHQDVPFELLVQELNPEREPGRNPLFQVMFVHQPQAAERFALPGAELELMGVEGRTSKFDLTLFTQESGEGLRGMLEYDAALFDAERIEAMAEHLKTLFEAAGQDPSRRASALPILPDGERRLVLVEWNGPSRTEDERTPVTELVWRQARQAPSAIAVEDGEERRSYGELEEEAEALAAQLQGLGVGPESRVAICQSRSIDQIVSVLGVLEAGGACVPLDPSYPAERLSHMLADSGAKVLLTERRHLGLLSAEGLAVVLRDGQQLGGSGAPRARAKPPLSQLAYVLYTSGSTGKPKGVAMEHGALANLVRWQLSQPGFQRRARVLQFAPLSFDVSFQEIFSTLASGGTLVLVDEPTRRSVPDLLKLLERSRVGRLFLPAVALGSVASEAERVGESLPALAEVITAGEQLKVTPAVRAFFSRVPGRTLHNQYGPTETHVVTGHLLEGGAAGWPELPPIGRPIANARVYVLDEGRRPVPIGVPGELWAGGECLARGYLGRDDLTRARFEMVEIEGQGAQRLYRTGDLAQWSRRGELEFLGRNDDQVKIRGHRVELGEIEAALGDHPWVREVAVATREDAAGGRALAAFVVGRGDALDPAALRAHLKGKLPEYMVPAAFVAMAQLPRTPSGKVDRRALPAALGVVARRERRAPRTPQEAALAAIWSEVLGVADVGIDDDFFELGGHSLKASQVVSRVRETFGVELPLRALFEGPTVAALAAALAQLEAEGAAAPRPIERVARDGGLLPASHAQEQLLFLDELFGPSATYNVPMVLRIRGPLDPSAMEESLRALVTRHEILRTRFESRGGRWGQRIGEVPAQVCAVEDLRGSPWPRVMQRVREEAARPFDLRGGPLMRARLFRVAPEDHVLVLALHHAAVDLRSLEVVARELGVLYAARATGAEAALPELPLQYADWAAWQRRRAEQGGLAEGLEYWRSHLAGAPGSIALPADRPRPARPTHAGGHRTFALSASAREGLTAIARRAGASLFMTMLSGFAAYLTRVSGQAELVVGTPAANRGRKELEGLVGFFVNSLALRLDASGDPSFSQLVERVRRTCLDAFVHQDVPFEALVRELEPEREPGRNPLFQVMFVHQVASEGRWGPPEVDVEVMGVDSATSKFDLTLFIRESPTGLEGMLEYDAELFDEESAAAMAEHLKALYEGAARDPSLAVSALPLLGAEERQRLLVDWNATASPAPGALPVHALVALQAQQSPDALAICQGGARRTYRELEEEAAALARELQVAGVGPESRVAIALGRSIAQMVGVLGVLKAGGACVPLDSSYPRERLALMLEDSGAGVLLTDREHLDAVPAAGLGVVRCDGPRAAPAPGEAPDTQRSEVGPRHLAYVLYTSGSTGRPKGVAMEHGALSNLVRWQVAQPGFRAGARALQFAPLSFDVSFQEIFSTWCSGGALVLVDDETRRSPPDLLRHLAEQSVERIFLPAVALQAVASEAHRTGEALPALREVIAAGEQLKVTAAVRGWMSMAPGRTLHNQYGPTETHVITEHRLEGDPALWPELPPIGRPIANARIYLLDERLRPVPVGVPGELYAAGSCLARGYLGRDERTAARFRSVAIEGVGVERLYRTGDVARYQRDGSLEFLGRNDDQVKIRGYRVELGEIEAALCAIPGVLDAAAVAREEASRGRSLAAFVVFQAEAMEPAALRAKLGSRLPEPMVPASFAALARLPRTPSGKVDRRALLAIDPGPEVRREARAPRSRGEEVLAAIWAEVLGRPAVDLEDDFFELGGHSLLAMQVVSRVREAFGVELPLRALFERPTLAALASELERLEAEGRTTQDPIQRVDRAAGALPVSYAQERLLFLEELLGPSATYNVPMALRLRGPMSAEGMEESLRALVARHEVLRTTFASEGGRWTQRIGEVPAQVSLAEELPAEPWGAVMARVREEAEQPFDLQRGPPMRARLMRLAADDHVLVLTMHHAVADLWSTEILARELGALYAARGSSSKPALPELPVQYVDWAAWQRRRAERGGAAEGLEYFKRQLAGAPAFLDLPADRPRPSRPSFAGGTRSFALSRAARAGLEGVARRTGASLFMTMLSGFAAYLSRITGQADLVVGSPAANRGRKEVEGLIGFFLNTLALRIDLSGDPTFANLVERVRRTCLDAFAHEELPFERLVQELKPDRDPGRNPLFQVLFVHQARPAEGWQAREARIEVLAVDRTTSKFDLTLFTQESGDGLRGVLEYNAELFDGARIEAMAEHLRSLFEAAARDPMQRVSALPLLGERERTLLLTEWNATERPEEERAPVTELVSRQARERPSAIALEQGEERRSYGELEEEAEALAAELEALGVGPESRVAICQSRSIDQLVSALAVLKAGGACVPLDPSYPAERLGHMLADSGAKVLLTEREHRGLLPAEGLAVVVRGAERSGGSGVRKGAPGPRLSQLAYVLYTSGSTGKPKGVAMEHGALANLVRWQISQPGFQRGARVLQFAPLSFDVSFQEIFSTLGSGGTLVVVDEETRRSPPDLVRLLEEARIGRLFLPAVALSAVASEAERTGAPLESLKEVITAGEQLKVTPVVRAFFARVPGRTLHNQYGPTETHVVTGHLLAGDPKEWPELPTIGRPIANARVYVLDEGRRPVPVGVAGELWAGGECLSRGYLGKEEMTRARFEVVEIEGRGPERLYRTGDLARWSREGSLEFLGRNDDQVKIRGYRVELGEVEVALSEHGSVKEAAVVARGDGERGRFLAAFVVGQGNALNPGALRAHLKGRLPEYMVPSSFVPLAQLPRTPSGKVDRRALPAISGAPSLEGYEAPRDAVELKLVELFEEVLGVTPVSIHDHFFERGGHSLLAVRLKVGIERELGVCLALPELFRNPTPKALRAAIQNGASGSASASPLVWLVRAAKESEGAPVRAPTLFALPGFGSRPYYFLPLARHLGPGVNVIGLQPRGFDGEGAPHATVEEAATYYLDAMREVCPSGPYLLAGHSSGGHAAYEIAQQLLARGEEVRLVALFDTPAPVEAITRAGGQQWSDEKWASVAAERFAVFLGVEPAGEAASAEGKPPLEKLVELLQRAGFLPEGAGREALAGLLSVVRAQYGAAYHPRALRPLPLHLFRALEGRDDQVSEEVKSILRDETLGWARLLGQPVAVHPAPGDHFGMLKEPHAEVLGKLLRRHVFGAVRPGAEDESSVAA
jgi:amino acid adenylation domain-containing protein